MKHNILNNNTTTNFSETLNFGKVIAGLTIICLCSLFCLASCSLDYEPQDTYSEITEGLKTDTGFVILKDRAAVLNQRDVIYNRMKYGNFQEFWYEYPLLISETHSDNSYAGSPNAETTPFEVNSIEGSNSNLTKIWNEMMDNVVQANKLIQGIDELKDPALSDAEAKVIRAEGQIFRALVYFDMARIWGRVPLITSVGKDITAENIDEIYPAYFPPQTEEIDVYKQIEKDLLEALEYAPNNNVSDKTQLTKSVAKAILAKVYAEKPLRNYAKVIQYADEIAADGFALVNNLEDLWGVQLSNPALPASADNKATGARMINTQESILEAQYSVTDGNWVTWMFGRSLNDYDFYFEWAKWITPSRDLIAAFDAAGDTKRKNQSIVYYACGWNIYYPAANYPFMYKTRSAYNSIIKMRFADILLLKAEALIQTNDLGGAAIIINQIRQRAGLGTLPASATASKDALLEAYLKERRLELAFEGERWYDLCRLDKVEVVMNNLHDSGRPANKYQYDQNSYKLPIPQDVIDQNPNLTQNPGY